MSRYHTAAVLSALLLTSPHLCGQEGVAGSPVAPAPVPIPLESRLISFETDGSISLQGVTSILEDELGERPNIIFKPGTESLAVPRMQLENVRLMDFLKALEDVVGIEVDVEGTSVRGKDARLIFIISPKKAGRFPSLQGDPAVPTVAPPPATKPQPSSLTPADPFAPAPTTSTDDPFGGGPGVAHSQPAADPFAPDAPDLEPAGDLAPTRTNPSITRCFAIRDLINGKNDDDMEHPAVVDAIMQMWDASQPEWRTQKHQPDLSFHKPTSLLIIRASQNQIAEAEQVLTSMRETIQNRERENELQAKFEAAINRTKSEAHREIEHIKQLHEMTLEKMKMQQAEEVEVLREELNKLREQLTELDLDR